MKSNFITKALAFAMLMPALLFTAACNSDFINDEGTDQKGFALPVTVKVTRQNTDTKATFNDGTKKLSFSEGDKLFVGGSEASAGYFDGALNWVSEGTFSGTITTQNSYSGSADDLFKAANYVSATLLPAGYEDYDYLYIEDNHSKGFENTVAQSDTYTFATSKAAGVEQFSLEKATSYSSGFALSPQNAILNFTITGLAASTNVAVSLTGSGYNITKTIITNSSGNAVFAAGIGGNYDLHDFTLTVGGKVITLASGSKTLTAGKIYNITAPAADPLTIEAITAGTIVVKSPQNGMQYSLNGGATKVAMTGYTTTNIPVEAGQKVRFYGNGTSITAYGNGHDTSFGGSGDGFTCKVYGNIMSLLDETGYATATTLSSNYVFWGLFSGNTALTDASGLLLPAMTLTEACYQVMFSNCSNLTAAPELPATTLVRYCYQRMFKGCTSLTSVKCLATSGINTNQSTYSWLDGVSATGTFTKAASATWPTPSSSGIPSGWTVVDAE